MPDIPGRLTVDLSARTYSAPDLRMRELKPMNQLRVQALRPRGNTVPAADLSKLPVTPNTTSGTDPIALWKGPDDWLVCSQTLSVDGLNEWVSAIASGAALLVADVSCANVVIELSGARAVETLLRDCTLDLLGEAIPMGACARTQFAQTSVMIHHASDPEAWLIFVDRSVTLHVWEWLVDSAGAPDS